MEIRTVPIGSLHPAEYNPRLDLKPGDADYDKLARVIDEFDLVEPLVWNERTGHLVGGHQRLKVLAARGDTQVDVSVVDLDPERERALNIALNKTGGDWDLPLLVDLLSELEACGFDLDLTGFDTSELDRLFAEVRHADEVIEDEAPEPPAEPVTRLGDVWLLGEHRLVCGDATDCAVIERLMGEAQADVVFTDPPYGVAYVGKTKRALTIRNDEKTSAATRSLVAATFSALAGHWKEGGVFYVCSPAGDMELAFRLALIDAGLTLRQQLVWAKDAFVLGRSDYHWRHETILYGWKSGAAHRFSGGRTQDTVWEIARPKKSEEHPTMKPVALVAKALENSSRKGEMVLDPFGGSGTTLIAAEQLRRACRMVEIDPAYCDVVVRRWENFTGMRATRG